MRTGGGFQFKPHTCGVRCIWLLSERLRVNLVFMFLFRNKAGLSRMALLSPGEKESRKSDLKISLVLFPVIVSNGDAPNLER